MGMPKSSGGEEQGNAFAVLPTAEQPYFMLNRVKVPQTAGLGPTRLDFKLTRGVWITGRLTDQATGEAVVPARLAYIPSQTNSLAASLPEFKRSTVAIYDHDQTLARSDGTFRLVGLPGRGLVAAWAVNRSYRVGAGASEIAGMTRTENIPVLGLRVGQRERDEGNQPAAGHRQLTCDLALDPGGTLRLSIVDETGKPAGTCMYYFNPHQGSVNGQGEAKTRRSS